MKFEVFEAMYQKLWELIYNILKVLGVELENPYAGE